MTSIVQADVSSGTDGGSDVGDVGSGVSSPSARGRPFNGSPDATESTPPSPPGALPVFQPVELHDSGKTDGEFTAELSTTTPPSPSPSYRRKAGRSRRCSVEEIIEEMQKGSSSQPFDGDLDLQLFTALALDKYRLRKSVREIRDAFDELEKLDGRKAGKVAVAPVQQWIRSQVSDQRRNARRVAKTLFYAADEDGSGFLDKAEVAEVAIKLQKKYPEIVLEPPFDVDKDFAAMDKDGAGRVTWDEFSSWWSKRSDDVEAALPILPEALVTKINDSVAAGAANKGWDFLRPRLFMLVRMQRWWGNVHDLYAGVQESLFMEEQLPRCIRHPDSAFTRTWDLIVVAWILWVAVLVPYRIGFDVDTELSSWTFVLDVVIDTFFIVDICFNFRTAFMLPTGFMETRPSKIAKNYASGWLLIDLAASIPLSYVTLLVAGFTGDEGDQGGNSLRPIKALRFVRLAKLLRVARLKRIIGRHASLVTFSAYLNSIVTLLLIFYAAHLLACLWYLAGSGDGGWVSDGFHNLTEADMTSRYAVSIYTIFKLGDGLATQPQEQWMGFWSEIAISVIYGALAGVMSTLMMTSNIGEQEYLVKLSNLRAWVKAKRMGHIQSSRIMAIFSAKHQSTAYFDEQEILSYLPLSLSREMSLRLYGHLISECIFFRSMGNDVVLAICQAIVPVSFATNEMIYEEGTLGDEMYFLLNGEVEVLRGKMEPFERLGFIGQGGFFGEATILTPPQHRTGGSNETVRMRTMRATTESDLAMLPAQGVQPLCERFPQLEVRLGSFRRAQTHLSTKGSLFLEANKVKSDLAKHAVMKWRTKIASSKLQSRAQSRSMFTKETSVQDESSEENRDGQAELTDQSEATQDQLARRFLKVCNGDMATAIKTLARILDTQ